MSKFQLKPPVVHIPSFKEYEISAAELKYAIKEVGLKLPLGMLDGWYYYTDLEGWGSVLYDLTFKSGLYKDDRFDCDNMALKAMNECAERYGLNTMAFVIGDIPQGRHGFNMFFHGDGFMLHEPNAGFEWGGYFELGDNGYKPDLVLI
jgi:hypothetical protein